MNNGAIQQYGPLIGRILISTIFIIYGFEKAFGFMGGGFAATSGALASKGLPMPDVLTALTILIEAGGGLSLSAARDSSEFIGDSKTQTVTFNNTELVGLNKNVVVVGINTETVLGNKIETIGGTKTETVSGAKTTAVIGALTETVSGAAERLSPSFYVFYPLVLTIFPLERVIYLL